MRLRTLLIAASAALALAASPALAQQDEGPADDHSAHHPGQDQPESQEKPSGGMGGGMMGQGGMQGGMMGRGEMRGMRGEMGGMSRCPRMADMMGSHGKMRHGMMPSRAMTEARLAFIKTDLEITEAQMPQWDAYAEAVRDRQKSMAAMHEDKMKAKGGTAVERMDARIKSMETMLDGLKALKGPTEALYASLSDEQKKQADQLLGGRCGMM